MPQHLGVVYCRYARFPGTRLGMNKLRKALVALISAPPDGLGEHSSVWWLANPD